MDYNNFSFLRSLSDVIHTEDTTKDVSYEKTPDVIEEPQSENDIECPETHDQRLDFILCILFYRSIEF